MSVPSARKENWYFEGFYSDNVYFGGTPVICEGVIYIPGKRGPLTTLEMHVVAVRLADGEVVWKLEYPGVFPLENAVVNKKYLCAGGIVFSRETGEVILDPYAYGDGLRYARAGIIETENGFLIPAREESENYYLLWADVHNKNVTIESVETDRLYYRAVDPEVMLGVYGAFDEEADYFTVRNIQSGQVVWRRPRHELEPYGGVLLGRTVIHKKKLYVIEGIDQCTGFDL
ncbi:hypothetical protein, partial [uncultured Abyssibacter sp.]|uniref:hypothetical protein n=1 Tax=uncultured Abyssibacter sp. TaxID=2320202 RepID=UPI0032B2FE3D